jgi:hypothetical protein
MRWIVVLAALAFLPSALAADAGISQTRRPRPAPEALTWKPPGYPKYPGYVQANIADSGQACPTLPNQNPEQYWVCVLAANTDYVLHLGHRRTSDIGSLVFTGGRNIVIIGGEVEIGNMPDASSYRREALVFHYQTGIVHVEGVHVYGKPLRCIVFDSAQATFQIENFRCDGVYMWEENFGTPHSDTWMTWLSPPAIRFDKFTGDFDNTGFAIYQSLAAGTWPGHVTLKRVNLRNSPTFPGGGDIVVVSRNTRLKIDRFYSKTGWGREPGESWPALGSHQWKLWDAFVDENWQAGNVTLAKIGRGERPGSHMVFTNPVRDNVWGVGRAYARISYGIPPGGDFVPLGVAGEGYIPRGYRK